MKGEGQVEEQYVRNDSLCHVFFFAIYLKVHQYISLDSDIHSKYPPVSRRVPGHNIPVPGTHKQALTGSHKIVLGPRLQPIGHLQCVVNSNALPLSEL